MTNQEPELQKSLFDLHTKIYNEIKTPTSAATTAATTTAATTTTGGGGGTTAATTTATTAAATGGGAAAPTIASVAAGIVDITELLKNIKTSMQKINQSKNNPLYNNFLKIPELTKENLKAGQLIVDCTLIRSVATTASMTNSDGSIVSSTVKSSSTADSNNDIADDDTIRDFISSILPVNIIDTAAPVATSSPTELTQSEKLTELFTSIVSSISLADSTASVSTASASSTGSVVSTSLTDTYLIPNMSKLITNSVGQSALKPNIVSTGTAASTSAATSAATSVSDVRILTIKSSTTSSSTSSSSTTSSSTINIDNPLDEGSITQTLFILHQLATIAIMSLPETKNRVLADPVNIPKGNGHFIVVGKLYCINGIVIPPNFSDILNIYANSTDASPPNINFADYKNYKNYDATTHKLDDKLTDAQINKIRTDLKIDDFCPVVKPAPAPQPKPTPQPTPQPTPEETAKEKNAKETIQILYRGLRTFYFDKIKNDDEKEKFAKNYKELFKIVNLTSSDNPPNPTKSEATLLIHDLPADIVNCITDASNTLLFKKLKSQIEKQNSKQPDSVEINTPIKSSHHINYTFFYTLNSIPFFENDKQQQDFMLCLKQMGEFKQDFKRGYTANVLDWLPPFVAGSTDQSHPQHKGGNITKKHKQSGGNYTRKNYYD